MATLRQKEAIERRRRTRHHMRLLEACHPRYETGDPERQALVCPFYVSVAGPLGNDWGVIMNPASSRYALLTFEHADCGCPTHPKRP